MSEHLPRQSRAVPGTWPHSAEWHRAFGLHSGIPPCCVDAWVRHYYGGEPDAIPPAEETHEFPGQYRPCRACLERGTFAPIVECGRDCLFIADCALDRNSYPAGPCRPRREAPETWQRFHELDEAGRLHLACASGPVYGSTEYARMLAPLGQLVRVAIEVDAMLCRIEQEATWRRR